MAVEETKRGGRSKRRSCFAKHLSLPERKGVATAVLSPEQATAKGRAMQAARKDKNKMRRGETNGSTGGTRSSSMSGAIRPAGREERSKLFVTFRSVRLIEANDERSLKMMEV